MNTIKAQITNEISKCVTQARDACTGSGKSEDFETQVCQLMQDILTDCKDDVNPSWARQLSKLGTGYVLRLHISHHSLESLLRAPNLRPGDAAFYWHPRVSVAYERIDDGESEQEAEPEKEEVPDVSEVSSVIVKRLGLHIKDDRRMERFRTFSSIQLRHCHTGHSGKMHDFERNLSALFRDDDCHLAEEISSQLKMKGHGSRTVLTAVPRLFIMDHRVPKTLRVDYTVTRADNELVGVYSRALPYFSCYKDKTCLVANASVCFVEWEEPEFKGRWTQKPAL